MWSLCGGRERHVEPERRLAELEARRAQTSCNSSKPPPAAHPHARAAESPVEAQARGLPVGQTPAPRPGF
ncbi:MAG: DUF6444 domain-containing protein [Planctomycetaceae bacterium]